MSDFELKWDIYELPKTARAFIVKKTAIHEAWGMFPDPEKNIYRTRNEAKRAVARYRKEAKEYWYSHPKCFEKNIKKQMAIILEKEFEEMKKECVNKDAKTIKIKKIELDGLTDYKRIKE